VNDPAVPRARGGAGDLGAEAVDWQRLFEEGLEPQLLLDQARRVVAANRAARGLLETDPPSLIGYPCLLLIDREYRRDWLEVIDGAGHRADPGVLRSPLVVRGRSRGVFDLTVVALPEQTTSGTTAPASQVTIRDATADVTRDRLIGHLEVLHTEHREALDALTAAFDPRPLPSSALELGVAARAVDPGLVGGDLHDWQLLGDGTVHLGVVDATGRGTLATRSALTVRDAARVLAVDGCPIGELLPRTEAVCAIQDAGLSAAVVFGRYDPADGSLAVVTAGQPPALLRRTDGGIERLGAPGPPLGFADGDRPPPQTAQLGDGDVVVLATDGAIEGRGRGEDGLTGLETALSGAAGDTATALADALLPSVTLDDAVLVVLRCGPPSSRRLIAQREQDRCRIVVHDARTRDVTAIRRTLEDWLRDRSIAPLPSRRALLIVSELVTNAVSSAPARIEVTAEVTAGRIELEVHDGGAGFDLERAVTRVDGGGFGLLIAEDVSDDLHVASGPDGTVMRAGVDLANRRTGT
jgi:anti-sigma regulatory factor (Ser/Thr protein kinase)